MDSRQAKRSKKSSTKAPNLQLALVPKGLKLWKCGDCAFRTNFRKALTRHRGQLHGTKRQPLFKARSSLSQQSSERTVPEECSKYTSRKKRMGNPRGKVHDGPGRYGRSIAREVASSANSVKYQCHECMTSSTQLHKILEYKKHQPRHKLLLHCPHCEYTIDYTTSALTRMKNHCLTSHIKMRCQRCITHVFKGHQAGSVLEHLQTHLAEDETWLNERTTADALGNRTGWSTGRYFIWRCCC